MSERKTKSKTKLTFSNISQLIAESPTPALAAVRIIEALERAEQNLRSFQCKAFQSGGACLCVDRPYLQPCSTCPRALGSIFDELNIIERAVEINSFACLAEPGPWHAHKGNVVMSDRPKFICSAYPTDTDNAKLIAAAPDMAELLGRAAGALQREDREELKLIIEKASGLLELKSNTTPGPWRIDREDAVRAADCTFICSPESLADARLIAAVPEMMELLEELVKCSTNSK